MAEQPTPGNTLDTTPSTRRVLSRRNVVKTTAWAVPAVTIVSTAPAFAASGDVIARTSPAAAAFSANQTATTQVISVTVTNGNVPVVGRNILFSVAPINGGSTDWLSFSSTGVSTDADGVASTTLQYGTPKPAAGSTYTIRAVDPADTSLEILWTLTFTPAAVAETVFTNSFDTIATTWPIDNFTVRTGATAAALGTPVNTTAAARPPQQAATITTGAFYNAPSPVGGAGSRAIAVRQSGSFGDPGASFVVRIGSMVGYTNVSFTFDVAQIASSIGQATPWVVDAFDGSTKVNSVAAATFNTGPSNAPQTISGSFASSLAGLADVYIRIAAVAPATGTGSRAFTAIDNWTITRTPV